MDKFDIDFYRACQKSPIFFIEKMWKLTPQPLKPEFIELAKTSALKDYKKEWFAPFIKGQHITWQQWVILLAVEKSMRYAAPKRISVASGHGIGKDACLSWLILWYLFCFKNAQVPCTAPTSEQIHDILWKELALWMERMPKPIAALYEWSTEYLRIKEAPETWFARARTARKENPEALAGVHGDFVFIVGDEASGIPNEIFRPAEGAMTNENILVILLSNPTRLLGYFYDTHHSDRMGWQSFQFSSEDSPIVEPDYIERIIAKYGIDSDEYRFMVKGWFPKEDMVDDKGYVPLLLEGDLKMVADETFVGNKRLGIDPAGEGSNETVWILRDKFRAKILATEATSTGKSIAQKTMTLMAELGITNKMAKKDVIIDSFGVGVDAIKELALAGIDVNSINVGDRVPPGVTQDEIDDHNAYINKRAMIYDRLKKWLRSGAELVQHEDWKQLLQIKYRRELSGKMKIMSKEEMRKLGIKSPDAADALSLTFIIPSTNVVDNLKEREFNQRMKNKKRPKTEGGYNLKMT